MCAHQEVAVMLVFAGVAFVAMVLDSMVSAG